jgi:hypothetical protein
MRVASIPLDGDPVVLADWMEIGAILTRGPFSSEDLKGELRRNDFMSEPGELPRGEEETDDNAADLLRGLEGAVAGDVLAPMWGGSSSGEEEGRTGPDAEGTGADSPTMVRDERRDGLVASVFGELQYRQQMVGSHYPFDVQEWHISYLGDAAEHVPYVFCMLVSYLRMTGNTIIDVLDPPATKLFEKIARMSIRGYLGAECIAYIFGFPRDPAELPQGFAEAVERIFRELGEGGAHKDSGGQPQDDKVDIIAWVPFCDGREGKLVVFGNCTTAAKVGGDKAREMNIEQFYKSWATKEPDSPHVAAYFFPHRHEVQDFFGWQRLVNAQPGGQLVFERCRLASWARPAGDSDVADHRKWIEAALDALSEDAA